MAHVPSEDKKWALYGIAKSKKGEVDRVGEPLKVQYPKGDCCEDCFCTAQLGWPAHAVEKIAQWVNNPAETDEVGFKLIFFTADKVRQGQVKKMYAQMTGLMQDMCGIEISSNGLWYTEDQFNKEFGETITQAGYKIAEIHDEENLLSKGLALRNPEKPLREVRIFRKTLCNLQEAVMLPEQHIHAAQGQLQYNAMVSKLQAERGVGSASVASFPLASDVVAKINKRKIEEREKAKSADALEAATGAIAANAGEHEEDEEEVVGAAATTMIQSGRGGTRAVKGKGNGKGKGKTGAKNKFAKPGAKAKANAKSAGGGNAAQSRPALSLGDTARSCRSTAASVRGERGAGSTKGFNIMAENLDFTTPTPKRRHKAESVEDSDDGNGSDDEYDENEELDDDDDDHEASSVGTGSKRKKKAYSRGQFDPAKLHLSSILAQVGSNKKTKMTIYQATSVM